MDAKLLAALCALAVLLGGCASAPAAPARHPEAHDVSGLRTRTWTLDVSFQEVQTPTTDEVVGANCVTFPPETTLLNGTVSAEWAPSSALTGQLRLLGSVGTDLFLDAPAAGSPVAHAFANVHGAPNTDVNFFVRLPAYGANPPQDVTFHLTATFAGPEPTPETAACKWTSL